MRTCLGTANQARHSDAFVSASLHQSHRCASALAPGSPSFQRLGFGCGVQNRCLVSNTVLGLEYFNRIYLYSKANLGRFQNGDARVTLHLLCNT